MRKRLRKPLSTLSPCSAAWNSSGVDTPKIDSAGDEMICIWRWAHAGVGIW